MNRTCGACTLCCKLVPVVELEKKGGQRCRHQRQNGCRIYPDRPLVCRLWNCAWLHDEDTHSLSRPDRVHYVIDTMPDYVEVAETGQKIPVLQIWCDPDYPLAHRDPALRKLLDERHVVALIRFDERDAMTLFPPSLTADRKWVEHTGSCRAEFGPGGAVVTKQHDLVDIMQVVEDNKQCASPSDETTAKTPT